MASPPPRPPPPPDVLSIQRQSFAGTGEVTTDTPPPPPPKPGASQSGTPYSSGPYGTPAVPPNPYDNSGQGQGYASPDAQHNPSSAPPAPPGIDDGWLPDIVKEQSKTDLSALLSDPTLVEALLHAPTSAHPSLPASDALVLGTLNQNLSLAQHVSSQAAKIAAQRADVASRLVQLRALERQWNIKQTAMDDALAPFSPKALHARLVAGINEQESLLGAMEESFLENEGKASEREVQEFVKRWRDARKTLGLRRERRRRFEEGRVGGWR